MLSDLIEVLDRQFLFLDSRNDLGLVAELFSFVRFLRAEPRIHAALEDARREEEQSIASFNQAEQAALVGLRTVRAELVRVKPASAAARSTDQEIPRFDDLADRSPDVLVDGGREPDARRTVHRLLAILRNDLAGVTDQNALIDRVNAIGHGVDHATRTRILDARTSGGAALARIEAGLRDLHPDPARDFAGEHAELLWHARIIGSDLGRLYSRLFGMNTAGESEGGTHVPPMERGTAELRLRADARLLYEDVRRRLGSERSLFAVLHAFKERAQWFDAARLRDLVQRNTRRGEELLAEQVALFLFDQGLRPLTSPVMSRLRPDIVHLSPPYLYVEAKLLRTRRQVCDGAYQMWNTIGRIRSEGFPIREAFLAVFRVGEPTCILPEAESAGGVTIYPLLIDIASGKVSGSKKKTAPIEIVVGDLAPQRPTGDVRPPSRHGQSGAAGRPRARR